MKIVLLSIPCQLCQVGLFLQDLSKPPWETSSQAGCHFFRVDSWAGHCLLLSVHPLLATVTPGLREWVMSWQNSGTQDIKGDCWVDYGIWRGWAATEESENKGVRGKAGEDPGLGGILEDVLPFMPPKNVAPTSQYPHIHELWLSEKTGNVLCTMGMQHCLSRDCTCDLVSSPDTPFEEAHSPSNWMCEKAEHLKQISTLFNWGILLHSVKCTDILLLYFMF